MFVSVHRTVLQHQRELWPEPPSKSHIHRHSDIVLCKTGHDKCYQLALWPWYGRNLHTATWQYLAIPFGCLCRCEGNCTMFMPCLQASRLATASSGFPWVKSSKYVQWPKLVDAFTTTSIFQAPWLPPIHKMSSKCCFGSRLSAQFHPPHARPVPMSLLARFKVCVCPCEWLGPLLQLLQCSNSLKKWRKSSKIYILWNPWRCTNSFRQSMTCPNQWKNISNKVEQSVGTESAALLSGNLTSSSSTSGSKTRTASSARCWRTWTEIPARTAAW